MASHTSAAPPRSGSTTAADAKKRKREDVLPASFAWHQYIVVPPSVRKLSMYRLKGFKGFTPEAFYHFQDHLLALKIGHLVDGTEVPTSLEVCNVPTKFYGYFCGRLKTHQYLHLLIFSYLNEIVPFEIIKSMPFFKQTQNDRIRCLTGKKRRATQHKRSDEADFSTGNDSSENEVVAAAPRSRRTRAAVDYAELAGGISDGAKDSDSDSSKR